MVSDESGTEWVGVETMGAVRAAEFVELAAEYDSVTLGLDVYVSE